MPAAIENNHERAGATDRADPAYRSASDEAAAAPAAAAPADAPPAESKQQRQQQPHSRVLASGSGSGVKPSMRRTATTPSDHHPLSLAGGGASLRGLPRRVSSATDHRAAAAGFFGVVPGRQHAASVSTPGAVSPAVAGTAAVSAGASPSSPAVAALQAVAATGTLSASRRADADLLGLGASGSGNGGAGGGSSRRARKSTPTAGTADGAASGRASPGNSRRPSTSLFGGNDEATPRRPVPRAAQQRISRPSGGTPLSGGWAGYLDSLSRDEIEVLDTPFDVMSDAELEAALRPHTLRLTQQQTQQQGPGKGQKQEEEQEELAPSLSKTSQAPSPSRTDSDKQSSTPNTPQNIAVPLFPPSPPGSAATPHAEHPLRVLSRAVRELREVISRLEDENTRARETAGSPSPMPAAGAGRRASVASGASGLQIVTTPSGAASQRTSAEASPKPVALPSVAERTGDHLHDSLADALSTSLTSPTYTHLALMEPRLEHGDDADDHAPRSPTPSTRSARPKSPAPSTRSARSERGRAAISAASTVRDGLCDPGIAKDVKDKKSWGLFGWAKKPSRKGSISSLAPSVTGSVIPTLEEVDDDEWRRGDGGSAPSFRAIFLATRILTPDHASILVWPARANATLADLAHALVSKAQEENITVRAPPGRTRARSRAASTSSAMHVQAPVDANIIETPTLSSGPGYGDQALAATVGLGRTLLSLSRGKTLDETRTKTQSGIPPPLRVPRSSYATSQAPPHSPVTPNPHADTPPPSVELGTIVPDESRPPTVLLSRQNLGSFFQSTRTKLPTATRFESDEPPLTDRYGFIYDIQHASMLKDANRAGAPAPISVTGHIPDIRSCDMLGVPPVSSRPSSLHSIEERELRRAHSASAGAATSESPASPPSTSRASLSPAADSPSPPNGTIGGRSRRPTALEPTPSRPIAAAKDELTVSVRGASNIQSGASSSLGGTVNTSTTPSVTAAKAASRLTVSSLLDQLTDIHDKQQKARTTEWDAFFRRRTRRKTSSDARSVQDVGVSGAIAGVVSLAGTPSKSGQEQYRLFQRLVRRGIPIAYRADVWAECSGARDLMVPGEYDEILAVHRTDHSPVLTEIEKDVGRTFPGNVFFGGDGPGVAKLRRVLVAFAWHNPAVGYCQGMNMLAATLLLTHTDEEQAFWVLHCMIERLLPADYYAPSLVGSRADQLALVDLVAQHVPRIAAHLTALGVDLTSLTFGWFLSIFTDCLPVETLFRVWDVFFVEGHAVLFRVAIAILKLNEAELCATESATDLFGFVSGMTSRLWSADKLIALQHSYKAAVRDADIQALVERHARELQRELDGDSDSGYTV